MPDGLLLSAATLFGGVGLFLVGMSLMTDGLKLAAGNTLQAILANWTSTRYRGLGAGFLVTAVVQSSSAVTVSTIGFANAGLLTLEQAVWVIFGSNVGTTMTGWIVALVGFKINMEALALPIIGVGTVLKVSGGGSKRGALGGAVVGFGLLFLGIGVLKEAFEAFGSSFTLPIVGDSVFLMVGVYTLFGVLLTTLMQSSSAAIVVALSAAEGGLISLTGAAAVVVGANLGTTTTALLSMIGATSTAKRVAVSHVAFNVMTAIVALLILAPMLAAVEYVREFFGLSEAPATTLALFHTAFNVLGVAIAWPLSGHLIRWLGLRFRTREETEASPKYLDATVLVMPVLAATAMLREIRRLNDIARRAATGALSTGAADAAGTLSERAVVRKLAGEIGTFITNLGRTALPVEVANMLPLALRTTHRYVTIVDSVTRLAEMQAALAELRNDDLQTAFNEFEICLARAIGAGDVGIAGFQVSELELAVQAVDDARSRLRMKSLQCASRGELGMQSLDSLLAHATLGRDVAQQFLKATRAEISMAEELGGNSAAGSTASAAVEATLRSDVEQSTPAVSP